MEAKNKQEPTWMAYTNKCDEVSVPVNPTWRIIPVESS